MSLAAKKIFLIRLDKIGDLVSTLPVDQLSKVNDFKATWFIARGLEFIPQHSVPSRDFVSLEKNSAWKSFWLFFQTLRKEKPEIAVSFQAPWWISFALWLSHVPIRAGVLSQWHSFLFFNRGLRQRRSEARKHESDYNAELLNFALEKNSSSNSFRDREVSINSLDSDLSPVLKMISPELDFPLPLESKKYFVVHPGMAGSARNWPTKFYVELIEKILARSMPVVMTGTTNDEMWLKEIRPHFQKHSLFFDLQNKLRPGQLLLVLEKAQAVMAPSTGVLHLAASLGTKSVGVYSPVQVQHPRRWRARGPQVKIFAPEVTCPAVHQCLGPSCRFYDCMESLSVDSVLEALFEK